ncbi:MAG: ABC transporter permease subunit [Alphaproteobacteria bacterium]|nr:ABC transporter permease subunit [Alphaproteobacteria bacterium]MDP3531833.1 ABC transporter permease subunit [Alphaproteobacteria bacterium]
MPNSKTLNTKRDFDVIIKGRSLWADAGHRLMRNKMAVVGMSILGFIILLSVIAPYLQMISPDLFPFTFDEVDWDNISTDPSFENHHYFGTDGNGRDLFIRTLYGGRISIMVGFVATLVSLVIGVTYGATAGFLGGKTDSFMMRFVDVLYSLPFMFFVIILMVFFGRNIFLIFIALGAVEWLDMARIVRGQTLSIKKKEFVEAAHAQGVSTYNILKRHIIPNTLGPVAVYITLTIPRVIMIESFLSFLGLGVQEPMASWGVLISEGSPEIETAWWRLIFPAIFLAFSLFSLNFIGDGIRDALDPKDR